MENSERERTESLLDEISKSIASFRTTPMMSDHYKLSCTEGLERALKVIEKAKKKLKS